MPSFVSDFNDLVYEADFGRSLFFLAENPRVRKLLLYSSSSDEDPKGELC